MATGAGIDVYSLSVPLSKLTTEILPPFSAEESNDDTRDNATQPYGLDELQLALEVLFSQDLCEIVPASGTSRNLLFKNKNTIVNWYKSPASQVRVVITTVLGRRDSQNLSWMKETKMVQFCHIANNRHFGDRFHLFQLATRRIAGITTSKFSCIVSYLRAVQCSSAKPSNFIH